MGHHCSYARRRDGVIDLYYSHWGALTIARDFFWGLDAAMSFLDQHEQTEDGWCDDVFGEGGAAVDLDEHVLTIYGGEIYGPPRTLLIELANVIWKRDGFVVRDVETLTEVATALGVDPSEVETSYVPRTPVDVDAARGNEYFATQVMLDGVARFSNGLEAVLELGAERVAELTRLPDANAVGEKGMAQAYEVVTIDRERRVLEVSAYTLRNSNRRRHFASKWPGWDLRAAPPVEEPAMPLEQQIREVEKHLLGRQSEDMGKWFEANFSKEGAWLNPLATKSTYDGRPAAESANERFRSALAELMSTR